MQDQYNAVYGGLKQYDFYDNNKVKVKNLSINKKRLVKFNQKLFLVYTNQNRKSEKILHQVKKRSNLKSLFEISKLTNQAQIWRVDRTQVVDYKNNNENLNIPGSHCSKQ